MPETEKPAEVYAGRHLSMYVRGDWEFVTRKTQRPGVGIVAITDKGKVVLVEQYRPPVGHTVIELPAGLAGDVPGAEDEPLVEAAKRELLEETGYVASRWTELQSGYSSPGLTDEAVVLFLAEGLEKRDVGGGTEHEQIIIHEVALEGVIRWLREHKANADIKLFAGVFAVRALRQT